MIFDISLLVVFAVLVTLVIASIWLLWSAAWAIPKPFRMRWPWTVWLLLLPIISTIVCLFVLLPLANSYRRYFAEKKWPGRASAGWRW